MLEGAPISAFFFFLKSGAAFGAEVRVPRPGHIDWICWKIMNMGM